MSDIHYWAWTIRAHLLHPFGKHTWVPLEKDWEPEDPECYDELACWCCDAVRPR